MFWLLAQDTFEAMQSARLNYTPSAAELEAFELEARIDLESSPKIMSVKGPEASIKIGGVLTDTPDFFARFFGNGNTIYSEIVRAVALADADPNVKTIRLDVDSPGGSASAAWLEAMQAIAAAQKPVEAIVHNLGASAAYGLISQANTIKARNGLSKVGSIGTVVRMPISNNAVTITSSNAPNKRPDPTTEEGKRVIVENLDATEKIFIDTIASGRNTTAENVRENYGRGGLVYASDAIENGMIDGMLDTTAQATTPAKSGKTKTEAKKMDLNQLKAEHPGLYAQAVAAGREEALNSERERVEAHLILAESSGDMQTAIDAIKSGDGVTNLITAKHQAAAMKSSAVQARADEEGDLDSGNAQTSAPTTESLDDQTFNAYADMVAEQSEVV